MIVRCETKHPTLSDVTCQRVLGHQDNPHSRDHTAATADLKGSIAWR